MISKVYIPAANIRKINEKRKIKSEKRRKKTATPEAGGLATGVSPQPLGLGDTGVPPPPSPGGAALMTSRRGTRSDRMSEPSIPSR